MTSPDRPSSLPRPLLRAMAIPYGIAVAWRNRHFDRGKGVRRLGCAVVSIGNLTAGGTGKTPMVADTAKRLARLGASPIVAMRGYAADREGRSDEAELHRLALPGVPIVVGADRHASLLAAGCPLEPPSVVVLDDGFQHRRLARDLDVVLVDATRPSLDDPLLPAGWLREPASSLRRADAVVVTRAEGIDEGLAARIEALHGKPPIAWTRHAWDGIEVMAGSHDQRTCERRPVDWIRGRSVATLLGVGNPGSIRGMLANLGGVERLAIPARDHQAHGPREADEIAAAASRVGAECLLTTAKDWVKLGRWWRSELPVAIPSLRLEWLDGEESFEASLVGLLARRP
jgi:tetraacyldisaccharide 4'-kinase